jgi:hypothetical protein
MGNHDMNYDAKEDKLSDETFESILVLQIILSIMEMYILSF